MIKEIKVKSGLSPSKLPGLDYALNPYRGCEHGCIYCYAPSVIHWEKGKWGELVEAKINLPRILSKELKSKKKGVVGLGTVTDPYQPIEKRYEITRRCLELLLMHDFPVCIQTKSSLVLRDIDLFKRFSDIEVGITITSLDEPVRETLEPGASCVEERLHALGELSKNGIHTFVFLGPVMPCIIDADAIIRAIASVHPNYVLVDRLRMKNGVWDRIHEFILKHHPDLTQEYEKIFRGGDDYYMGFLIDIVRKCRESGLECEINVL